VIQHPTKKTTKATMPVDLVVVHYTASPGAPDSQPERMFRWLDESARRSSTHFIILRDGTIIQAAPTSRRTWHAGGSRWRGKGSVNKRSIGVDLENVGRLYPCPEGFKNSYGGIYAGPTPYQYQATFWEPYTADALDALALLVSDLAAEFPVLRDRERWAGHEEIKKTKSDPGPAFPWERLPGWLDGVCR
jgi:N-acetylmuramoyl-L-alanine amidase